MIAPLPPMLATRATPFDSEEYVFELKWDGIRALAAIEEHVPGLLVWFLDLDGSPVEQAIYIFGLAAVAALSTDAGDSRYAV